MTAIEWTDAVWNPVTGCTKVSQGCKNCYAEGVANRRLPHGGFTDRPFTEVRCHPERLQLPLKWRKPRRVFVNSMSDLFHEDVPDDFIDQVFAVMALAPQHTFQVLTKRPERMRRWFDRVESGENDTGANALGRLWDAMTTCAAPMPGWVDVAFDCGEVVMHQWPLPNVWIGVSVEDQATADERIPILLQTPAVVRFVSAEPLLGPVDLLRINRQPTADDLMLGGIDAIDQWWLDSLSGELGIQHPLFGDRASDDPCNRLNWIIVGGESGQGARPCNVEWIRSIVEQCKAAAVPVFVKQLGARPFMSGVGDLRGRYIAGGFRDGAEWITDRKGGDPDEWPADLQVRELPR